MERWYSFKGQAHAEVAGQKTTLTFVVIERSLNDAVRAARRLTGFPTVSVSEIFEVGIEETRARQAHLGEEECGL